MQKVNRRSFVKVFAVDNRSNENSWEPVDTRSFNRN